MQTARDKDKQADEARKAQTKPLHSLLDPWPKVVAVCLWFRKEEDFPMKPKGQRILPCGWGRWIGVLFLTLAAAVMVIGLPFAAGVVAGGAAGLILLGVAIGARADKQIKAGAQHDATKGVTVFGLSLDEETVTLEPGKTWSQVDHYKWVMRGLIEEPQSFHVFPDGSVEINAEKICITDLMAAEKLEHQLNKRHPPAGPHKPQASTPSGIPSAPTSDPRRFRVKLDHLGHVLIEWGHGVDREETGLRGIATLITNGLIRKPEHYRVDPMQRSIEIDGDTFECNAAGVKRLEEALNTRYASSRGNKTVAIEIKENLAASIGFDIHFQTVHVGVVQDIKGHLSQEFLDMLQDPQKCDLLQPGIHLLLTPPYLLIRRRRPDLGEERIPELPDVNLMRCNAAQLQAVLNHPMIHRSTVAAGSQGLLTATDREPEIVGMRVFRIPEDKVLLWLDCVTAGGGTLPAKAFTHHNVTEFQQSGVFRKHLDVHLSLDHRRLTIQNRETNQEEILTLEPQSRHEDLCNASRMLTNALKPRRPRWGVDDEPIAVPVPLASGTPNSAGKRSAAEPHTAAPLNEAAAIDQTLMASRSDVVGISAATTASKPEIDPTIMELFRETDPTRISTEIFRRLGAWLGIAPQDICLSLPFVFENRRFEVLSFEHQEIASVSQLRGVDYYGFYLSHVSEKKVLLVYACNGMHIEWGPDKCVLQPTITSEPEEYKGSVLVGMAQDKKDEFVFVVQPEFKKWISPREMPFTEENLQFLVVADIAAAPDDYKFIWPQRPVPPH